MFYQYYTRMPYLARDEQSLVISKLLSHLDDQLVTAHHHINLDMITQQETSI